ncbi:MAG: hypothetical protein Q4F56_00400 [Candidatus Saccharibacteria bacterium]|nr:hypothetical protein [Candidatus Saccharibacteria bacterium]
MMKERLRMRFVGIVVLATGFVLSVILLLGMQGVAYAGSDPGSEGHSGGNVACYDGYSYSKHLCDDGVTGGASWHVFRTRNASDVYSGTKMYHYLNGSTDTGISSPSSVTTHGPQYCKKAAYEASANCGSDSDNRINAFQGGGYDNNLAIVCPRDKYDFYIMYVFDGWNGRDGKGQELSKKKNHLTLWGPAAYGADLGGSKTRLHTDGSLSESATEEAIKGGTAQHGQRISIEYAKTACKNDTSGVCKKVNTKALADDVGYICVQWPRTLTGVAIGTNGEKLSGVDDVTDSVVSGKATSGLSAKVTAREVEGYVFKGWHTDKDTANDSSKRITRSKSQATESGANTYVSGSNYETFHVASLNKDETRYAVYERKKVALTAKSVDTNGKSLAKVSGLEDKSDTVDYGGKAYVTRGENSDYVFKGWVNSLQNASSGNYITITKEQAENDGKNTYVSGSGNRNFVVRSLKNDVIRYAVYEKKNVVLTAYARYDDGPETPKYIKPDGALTDNRGESWTNSSTVSIGSDASVSTSGFNPAGYSWYHWGTGGDCASAGSNRVCTINDLRSNKGVNAYYVRNSFTGQARAFLGEKNEGTPIASTGYVAVNTKKTASVDCENSGCNVTYDLYLKSNAGSGKTYFTGTGFETNKSDWIQKTSPFAPSGSGSKMKVASKTLKPGVSSCQQITFRPYGAYSDTATAKAEACVSANVTYFQGKSSISGAVSKTTDWQDSNKSEIGTIPNCSPTDGCKVSFTHEMKRTSSSALGSSNWSVSRTSNLTVSTRAISPVENLGSGTFNSNSGVVKNDGEHTLYPGMVVCETLKFKPSNDSTKTVNDVSTTVCASALGGAQPEDPSDPHDPNDPGDDPNGNDESNAFIDIQVKNNSVAKYNTYRKYVYAKPTDSLTYRATYNPILQYTYYLMPEQMRIDGGTIRPSASTKNTSETLGAMFNTYYDYCKNNGLRCWNNAMTVFSSNFASASVSQDYVYNLGSMTKQRESNNHSVLVSEVGRSLNETAITNRNDTTQTTPSQVTFTDNSGKNLGDVITAAKSSIAYARVPYNFKTIIGDPESDPTCAGKSGLVCAGEGVTIDFPVAPVPKTNCETTNKCSGSNPETYSTKIPEARREVVVYDPDSGGGGVKSGIDNWGSSKNDDLCSYFGLSHNETSCGYAKLTENDKDISTTGTKISATFYAQDKTAGSRICVAAALYPSNSGADTNWEDKEGSHTWRISESQCYTIAKKPSLQVWGGNVYSRGKIQTAVSVKNNLANYSATYSVGTKSSPTYVFGSWGELGVISSGAITGFASAASTGYAANNNGTLVPNPFGGVNNNSPLASGPGGSNAASLCNRSQLTFANSPCSANAAGALGNSIGANSADKDKSSIISKYLYGGALNVSGEVALNDESKIQENGTYYYHGNSLTLPGGTINPNTVQVVHAKNVIINSDLVYGGAYNNYDQMPKLVVYAENNISIKCGVGRVDAVLIAENEVRTCSDSNDINAEANSHQLVVNGAVITGELTPNRTYGAATGANSIIPAEVINFDPTLYRWDESYVGVGGSNGVGAKLDAVYTKEIAPRL